MHSALVATDESAAAFSQMPGAVRKNLLFFHQLMREIDAAPNKSRAMANIDARMGHLPGCDVNSLRRKFYLWLRHGRNTECLADRRKLTNRSPARAVAAVYKRYCEDNQRVSREAHRQLIRDIASGMELPGIGTWIDLHRALLPDAPVPARCPWGIENPPPGWSYANLQRAAGLSDFEKKASRQGLGAAMDCVLPVLRSRVGLLPGQFLQFDDMWLDLKAIFAGQRDPIRPLEMACYDVHSAFKLAWGIRPRIERADGTKAGILDIEFRFLLAHVLCEVGFHKDGVTLMVEHGTAAIREPLERLLGAFSGGAIKVARSGMMGEQVHAGLFPGRGRGNPRFKALIESSHSLAHNVSAALPAQTGSCPEMAPEQGAGMDAYCRALVKAAASLPAERRDQLLFPALHFNRLVSIVGEIYDRMNDRTWHDLEGWEECGYVVEEFRLGAESNWFPRDALIQMPPNKRAAVAAFLDQHPDCMRARQLSPREVFGRGKKELRRLPKCHVPDILGADAARRVRVQAHGTLEFQDIYLGPGKHVYFARIATPDGFVQSLRRDAEYMVHVTPYNADEAFVTDPDSGALLGYAPRYDRAGYGDTHAIEVLMGRQQQDLAEQAAPVRERHADQAAALAALKAHNEAVVSGAPVSPAQIAESARIRKTSGTLKEQTERIRKTWGTLADLTPDAAPEQIEDEADRAEARRTWQDMFG